MEAIKLWTVKEFPTAGRICRKGQFSFFLPGYLFPQEEGAPLFNTWCQIIILDEKLLVGTKL